ncbi:imidazole glycerol phosphate synthase glutamine amidotransferase subunit [Bacteroidales bacterium]|nr:imidazole glycerol phosphate synthase glutamine amidotransferase subunit [Bacteroidales bacterium]
MKVAIIKYNAGNVYSVSHALQRLGISPIVTDNKEELMASDKIIFPGVGEASTTMQYLKTSGLDSLIVDLKQPVLGICLGMQLLCSHSVEGNVDCLNIFESRVEKFSKDSLSIKVPHMGWNTIKNLQTPLFEGVDEDTFFYFVHSYYVPLSKHTIATCNYGLSFSAAIKKNNFHATQFHPEKSGDLGSIVLENFLK